MKHLYKIITACAISSILFTSCVSNMTIAKRHYNNGYYIAYNTNKQAVPSANAEEKEVQIKTNEPLLLAQNQVEKSTTSAYYEASPIVNNNEIVAINEKSQGAAISRHNIKQSLKEQIEIVGYPAVHIKHARFIAKKITRASADDNSGLSVFWVVILIVLVLWALGYWGFGLVTGLINLLLLIALILLILWLLRVV